VLVAWGTRLWGRREGVGKGEVAGTDGTFLMVLLEVPATPGKAGRVGGGTEPVRQVTTGSGRTVVGLLLSNYRVNLTARGTAARASRPRSRAAGYAGR
jgi:hypothetical protein